MPLLQVISHMCTSPVSPIRVLTGQILQAFENANPATAPLLRKAVATGRIDAAIDLDLVADIPRGSFAEVIDGSPTTIHLHIIYLEMLWAFTYGMFVSYEHEMRETMLHMRLPVSAPGYSETVRRRAGNLLCWSKKLRHAYSKWPADAPSPISYRDEEKELSGKVNTIFLAAVALILHHEFCHASQGHTTPGWTREQILELEKEADDFAHHQFLDGLSAEHDKRIRGWSVLIPPLSNLYLVEGPRGLFQEKHPHVHHRIAHALSRLNFSENENQDYFNGLCLSALTTFMIEHHILDNDFHRKPGLRKSFERMSDALEYFLGELDSLYEQRA
jgi:hypothetical protein